MGFLGFMNHGRRFLYLLLSVLVWVIWPLVSEASQQLEGSWTIVSKESSAIDPWRRITLEIKVEGEAIAILRTVSTGRRTSTQEYPLRVGETVKVPVAWWTGNRHIGAYIGGDKTKAMSAEWLDQGKTLRVQSQYILATQQGQTPVRDYTEYRISGDGDELIVIGLRSTRSRPEVHVFRRS